MKIERLLWSAVIVAVAACSSDEIGTDCTNETEQDTEKLLSAVPIEFAPVSMTDFFMEAETVTRGGSVDASNFSVDSVGIFCLSRTKLQDAPKEVSWSKAYNIEQHNLHNVWSDNEMAHVVSMGVNKGKIIWENTNHLNYYPTNAWYTYGFVAYHPWTQYIDYSKSYVHAYIPVDGNDDVLYAMAKPEAIYEDADVNELAYSKQYYDAIKAKGLPDQGAYPLFQFRRIMSRLDFSFCFNSTPNRNYHVDRVEFDDFINIVRLILAKQSNGDMIEDLSKVYVTNAPTSKFPELTTIMGHFELREKGEETISNQKNDDGSFKYNLTTEMKKVGDCILIPPVSGLPSAKIKLYVTLCDDNGNKYRNTSAINVSAPSGWSMGSRYDIRIKFNNSPNSSASPARRSASSTTTDGVTLWQPDAKVTITPQKYVSWGQTP